MRRFAILMGAADLADELEVLLSNGRTKIDLEPDSPKVDDGNRCMSPRDRVQVCRTTSSLVLPRKLKVQALSREHWRKSRQIALDAEVAKRLGLLSVECRRLRQAFSIYDEDDSGTLEGGEILAALTDLGLKPRMKTEKFAIQSLLDDGAELGFEAFCSLVQDCRVRAQDSQRSQLQHMFKVYDVDDSGALDIDELWLVLKDLGLGPAHDFEKRALMEVLLAKCDTDGSGKIEREEFELLVQCIRERLSECRREREQAIRDRMQLSDDVFFEFRPELVWLFHAFLRFDADNSNSLDASELRRLVAELGCELNPLNDCADIDVDLYIDSVVAKNKGAIGFVDFLKFVRMLRERQKERNEKFFRRLFCKYDRDESGELDLDEMGVLFADLGINPSNRAEQDEILKMVDDADVDGSHSLSFAEFAQLCQRVHEKLRSVRLDDERRFAKERLRFTEEEYQELRESFAIIDTTNSGFVSKAAMREALRRMKRSVTCEDMELFAEAGYDSIKFEGYLRLMKHLVDSGADASVQWDEECC